MDKAPDALKLLKAFSADLGNKQLHTLINILIVKDRYLLDLKDKYLMVNRCGHVLEINNMSIYK